ncbi:MAG: hypothetical protein JETCAE01_00540 [Anaerolineaceae bacterium]|nr:MAG: hypothetical protein JETCAE01_00540 [Anaerolineaceae bacterium]
MIHDQKRERRDWTLLIFIIPIGIFLIIIVGQIAIRLIPIWSVNADMNSNLEPDPNSARPFALLEPILPQILTPMAWMEYYLTPGADVYYPPFLTFSPTASPPPTEATPTATEAPPTQATPTGTPSPTSTSTTGTASPTNTPEETEPPGGSSTPPPTCTDPNANNQGQPLPCTYDPTTCEDPNANNQGQPLPCTYDPPPPVCPGAHNPNGPANACDYGDITTIDPGLTQDTTIDPDIGVDEPPDNDPSAADPSATPPVPPDNGIGEIEDGTYIVISLGVTVEATPDSNYDLVYYEWNNGGNVYLDWIIIGISHNSDGSQYYEVFNWGVNQDPDLNSNVSDYSTDGDGEVDDEEIQLTDLHDPDGAGPAQSTGILIDVDNAQSRPPPATYEFVVIISPPDPDPLPPPEGNAQVDAIQATEVPIPP